MKLKKLSLVLTLTLAITAVGCGKSNDTNNNGSPGTPVYNPGVQIPPPVNPQQTINPQTGLPNNPTTGGSVPVGCYVNGQTNCAPCPVGFTQAGNMCTQTTVNTAGNYGCQPGTFYNGYQCQQTNYVPQTCPYGTAWSNYYYTCVGTMNYQNTVPSGCNVRTYGGFFVTYVCTP